MPDRCRPVTVTVDGQEEAIRVYGGREPSEADREALGQLVAAARRHGEEADPHMAVRQELALASIRARAQLRDPEVRARLGAAVRAAIAALTPAEGKP